MIGTSNLKLKQLHTSKRSALKRQDSRLSPMSLKKPRKLMALPQYLLKTTLSPTPNQTNSGELNFSNTTPPSAKPSPQPLNQPSLNPNSTPSYI